MSTSPEQAKAEVSKAPGRRKPSGFIYVEVEESVRVDLDDIVEQLTDEQLDDIVDRCHRKSGSGGLLAIYEEFRRRGDAPQCLKDYLYDTLGRIL